MTRRHDADAPEHRASRDAVLCEAVRQMILALRQSLLVPASDVQHYLPIMAPILEWYADHRESAALEHQIDAMLRASRAYRRDVRQRGEHRCRRSELGLMLAAALAVAPSSP